MLRRGTRSTRNLFEELGPGVVTGAADDDPSGIATYSQTGAHFGYALLWTMPLSYPLLAAVQLISAHIGRVTGTGLAKTFASTFPRPVVTMLVGILLIANVFNIGADLAAMAAAAKLVAGGNEHLFVIGFALICAVLQVMVPYGRYAKILKWLTLSLFAYIAVILLVHVDWRQTFRGLIWPARFDRAAILTVVAIFGTTLSPYLFFWQSSQEAEEVATSPWQHPLRQWPSAASKQFRRMRNDTLLSMAFSHSIAIAIIIATAATLHGRGITDIRTAADAAQALRPIAGKFASALFAAGIIGTGLLAVPVLAGSAAFAVSEVRGWKQGLELKPLQAIGFYSIIVIATLTGVLLDWSGIDPIKALFWAAVLNGVAAVPIMVAMMIVASRPAIMGRFTERPMLMSFGWAATAVMAAVSGAMLFNLLIG